MFRIGIIGAGAIAKLHAEAIKKFPDRAKLVAVADIDKEAGNNFAKENHCIFYPDYEKMLYSEKMDIVCCCLPHGLHFAAGKAVLGAGLHLFMEKPMCKTAAECMELNDLAINKGRMIMVGHSNQYFATLLKAKVLIREGKIGYLNIIQTEWLDYNDWEHRKSWHIDPKMGGGVLMNASPHQMDHLLFFAESPVTSVEARVALNRPGIGVSSDICAFIRFANGITGVLTTLSGYKTDEPSSFICRLIGTRGAIKFNIFEEKIILAYADQREEIQLDSGLFGLSLEWWEFFNSVQQNHSPRTDGKYGYDIVRLSELIVESSRLGKEVHYVQGQ